MHRTFEASGTAEGGLIACGEIGPNVALENVRALYEAPYKEAHFAFRQFGAIPNQSSYAETMNTVTSLKVVQSNVAPIVEAALQDSGGLLRMAPCWVPRLIAHPGRRLKLHPDDLYAFGAHRGGIDERWFSSTIPASNEEREPDEGLSYVVAGRQRFTFQQAVAECGSLLIGDRIWRKYKRWPVYSKFFDTMGPLPFHLHQSSKQAALLGLESKPESYYFPPQCNTSLNDFPYTFVGLDPCTTKADIRRCLENWKTGNNGILDLSRAHRLKIGSGWLIPPRILHAPGSICTYEPQWGSDVFSVYQSLLDNRPVPWSALIHDVPKEYHEDLDYLVEQIDWEGNTNERFKEEHYWNRLLPLAARTPASWTAGSCTARFTESSCSPPRS